MGPSAAQILRTSDSSLSPFGRERYSCWLDTSGTPGDPSGFVDVDVIDADPGMEFLLSQHVVLYHVVLLHRRVEGAGACEGEVDAVSSGSSRSRAPRNAYHKLHRIEEEFPEGF